MNMPDMYACTMFSADLSFIGMANTHDMCMHIADKAHQCPLDVTGRQPMVCIASTSIRTHGISECYCGYLVIFGKVFAQMLHLLICLLIS